MEKTEERFVDGARPYYVWYENGKRKRRYAEKKTEPTLFETLWPLWLAENENGHKGTIKAYRRALSLANEFKPDLNWKIQDGYDFAIWLHERELLAASVSAYFGALSGIAKIALRREIWTQSPFQSRPRLTPNEPTRFRAFTPEQLETVWAALANQSELLAITKIVYFTFIRPGELARLTWENVDLVEGLIYIPAVAAKTKKSGAVVIPAPLRPFLEKLKSDNKSSEAILKRPKFQYTLALRKILSSLGFGHEYSLYSFKHTGASNLYRAKQDVRLVQKQCRHGSIVSTEKYLRSLTAANERERLGAGW